MPCLGEPSDPTHLNFSQKNEGRINEIFLSLGFCDCHNYKWQDFLKIFQIYILVSLFINNQIENHIRFS